MQTKTLANMKGRSRYNGGGALLLLLAALAFPFLAACSDDDDSDTVTLSDCVAIDKSVLSGKWTCNALGYVEVTLTFGADDSSFTAEVAMNGVPDITGSYALTDSNRTITVTTTDNASLYFYVLGHSKGESSETLTLYLKTATDSFFSRVLGQNLTFEKDS